MDKVFAVAVGHRRGSPVPLFFIVVIFIITLTPTPAACNENYVNSLIKDAIKRRIYENKRWLKLLHYRKTLFGQRSVIDDQKFFLSANGNVDPKAELIATIKGFFSKPNNSQTHPICRFPARFEWLKEELSIKREYLPHVVCNELREFLDVLKPEKAYLVFASYFMGSPASMYGHTFLLIVPKGSSSKLLSYVSNYAANVTDTNGILYAFKGVFGFYKGYFTIMPYYEKIKEYSHMEHRDLWEYELNLTPREVKFMVLHLWELRNIYSYYYFFSENCSYQLLFLLDVVRPEVSLTDRFSPWVIPVDTIRWAQKAGLIGKPVYRPSKATVIKALSSGLDETMIRQAIDISEAKAEPAIVMNCQSCNPLNKAKVLELASELIEINYMKKKLSRKVYQKRLMEILKTRTSLGTLQTYQISTPLPPEKGHDSSRLTLSYGSYDSESFYELSFRAAYHDLYDPEQGYLPNSEIEFGRIVLRYNQRHSAFHLQSFELINIESLAERDAIFKPRSWFVRGGYMRRQTSEGLKGSYILNTGGGFTWYLKGLGDVYMMGQTELIYSSSFEKNYSAGIGIKSGYIQKLHQVLKVGLEFQSIYYLAGEFHRRYSLKLISSLKLTKDLSLRAEILRIKTFGIYHTESRFSVNLYF